MALDFADDDALASPVRPESPVLPEKAAVRGAPLALIVLSLLVALTLASPVAPDMPESPVMATGLASAVEVAEPVSPVLVADDWAMAAPELPLIAEGDCVRLALPPSPPFALTSAIESPAVMRPTLARLLRPETRILAFTSPARPDLAVPRSPPRAPSPPVAVPFTALAAVPVSPETESADDWAPELALESAEEATLASPVRPLSPEFPDLAARSLPPALPLIAELLSCDSSQQPSLFSGSKLAL